MSNDAYAFGHANTAETDTANRLNQIATRNGVTFLYDDARGNLTGDGVRNHVYDSENRLKSSNGGNGNALFAYDPLGRLYEVAGHNNAFATTRFAYDGLDLISEHDGSNALLKRHVHGQGMDEIVASYTGTTMGLATRLYPHQDERGSIVAVSDGSGNVTGVYPVRYDGTDEPIGRILGAVVIEEAFKSAFNDLWIFINRIEASQGVRRRTPGREATLTDMRAAWPWSMLRCLLSVQSRGWLRFPGRAGGTGECRSGVPAPSPPGGATP